MTNVLWIFFGALIFCTSAQEIRFKEGQRYSFAYRVNQISSEDQYDIGLNHPSSGVGSLVYFDIIPRGSGTQKRDSYTDGDEAYYCEMVVTGAKVEKFENHRFVVDRGLSADFEHAMEEFSLYFSMSSDGRITEILANKYESKPIVNIKRGLLSTLQTKLLEKEEFEKRKRDTGQLKDLRYETNEIDVLGDCPARFSLSETEDQRFLTIRKRKDQMDDCAFRPLRIAKTNNAQKDVNVTTWSSSVHHIDLETSMIQKVDFEEYHEMEPVAPNFKFLRSRLNGKLQLSSIGEAPYMKRSFSFESWDDVVSTYSKRDGSVQLLDLIFEHFKDEDFPDQHKRSLEEDLEQEELSLERILNNTRQMFNETQSTVRAQLIRESVKIARDHPNLLFSVTSLISSVPYNEAHVLIDMIAMVGGPEASERLLDTYFNQDINETLQNYALMSLGYTSNPSLDVMNLFGEMIDGPFTNKTHMQIALTLGAMVTTYLRGSEDPEIATSEEVIRLVEILHRRLNDSLSDGNQIVLLRALGNAQHPHSVNIILRYLDEYTSPNVQSAAVTAAGKYLSPETPKDIVAKIHKKLLESFSDYLNPFDVRKQVIAVIFQHADVLTVDLIDKFLDTILVEIDPYIASYVIGNLKTVGENNPLLGSYLRRLHNNGTHFWNSGLHLPKEHFIRRFEERKRDLISDILSEAFGVDRFEIDVGYCEIKQEGFGGGKFGAQFRASFCNRARLKWPLWGFPMVDLLADDGVYAGASILGIKYTLINVGIYIQQRTGTWQSVPQEKTIANVGFYGPEVECPEGLDVQCGVGKCVSSVEECVYIRAQQLLNTDWNFLEGFDIDAIESCVPTPNPTSIPSCQTTYDNAEVREWLPDVYADNILCACEAIVPSDAPEDRSWEPARCVKKSIQEKFSAYPSELTDHLRDAKNTYNQRKEDIEEWWDLLPDALKDIRYYDAAILVAEMDYSLDLKDFVQQSTNDWIDAYDDCCCAAKPTWFASWISVLRTSLPKLRGQEEGCEFIAQNLKIFGWCDDKRSLVDWRNMTDLWFVTLADRDYIPDILGSRANMFPLAEGWQDEYPGAHHVFHGEGNIWPAPGKRGIGEYIINPSEFESACVGDEWTGDKTIELFRYTQSIPVYAGITLDFEISASLELGVSVGVDFCLLGLTATGSAGPKAGVSISVAVSISFWVIRAGVEIDCTLLDTRLTARAEIAFSDWPMDLCFYLDLDTEPLKLEVSIFYELRIKIVFIGLDWADRKSYPIGSWAVGSTNVNLLTICDGKEQPVPKPIDTVVEVFEDGRITSSLEAELDVKAYFMLEDQGYGAFRMTDSNKGTFTYLPLRDSDIEDSSTFLLSEGNIESPTARVTFKIFPVADYPLLEAGNTEGWEDPPRPIALNITAKLTDIDGSETLKSSICNCHWADSDNDGIGDRCDVCPFIYDPEQEDSDGDGIGDACCTDTLRAWWRFDETVGSRAQDYSGFGNHLKIQGGRWVEGSLSNALEFTRTTAKVGSTEINSLHFDGDFSLSLRMKFPSLPPSECEEQNISLFKRSDGNNVHYEIGIYHDTTQVLFYAKLPAFPEGVRISQILPLPLNWGHLVVAAQVGQPIKTYINGIDRSFVNAPVYDGVTSSGEFDVTTVGSRDCFNVILDEVQVFRKALNPREALYYGMDPLSPRSDVDRDGVADICDTCPSVYHPDNTYPGPSRCCLKIYWDFEPERTIESPYGLVTRDRSGNKNVLHIVPPANISEEGYLVLDPLKIGYGYNGPSGSLSFNGFATLSFRIRIQPLVDMFTIPSPNTLLTPIIYNHPFGQEDTSWGVGILFIREGPQFFFALYMKVQGGEVLSEVMPFEENTWMHFHVLFSDTFSFFTVYRDGTNVTSENQQHMVPPWTENDPLINLGVKGSPDVKAEPFSYDIDFIRVYDRQLNLREIVLEVNGNIPCFDIGSNKRSPAKRESTEDVEKLCGCGLFLDQGAKFVYANSDGTSEDVADTSAIPEDKLSSVAFQPPPDGDGDWCFMINAITTEERPAKNPYQQNAVTSKPITVTVHPINDPPQVNPPSSPRDYVTFTSIGTDYFVTIYDIVLEDPDTREGYLTVNMSTNGNLVFTPTGLVAYDRSPNNLVLYGTLENLNEVLYGITYSWNVGSSGTDYIRVEVTDNGNSGFDEPAFKRSPMEDVSTYRVARSRSAVETNTKEFEDVPPTLILLVPALILGADYEDISLPILVRTTNGDPLSGDYMLRLSSEHGNFTVGNPRGVRIRNNFFRQIRLLGNVENLGRAALSITYNSGGFCGDSDTIQVELNSADGTELIMSHEIGVYIVCQPNTPTLEILDATAPEDRPADLDIDLALTDKNEILSLEISDLPKGFVLKESSFNDLTQVWDVRYKMTRETSQSVRSKRSTVFLDADIVGPIVESPIDGIILNSHINNIFLWEPIVTPHIIPPANYHGSFVINVTGVSTVPGTNRSASITKMMTVTFTPVNDPPLIISPVKVYTSEDVPTVILEPFPLAIRDIDVDIDNNDPSMLFTLRAGRGIAPGSDVDDRTKNFWWYLSKKSYLAEGQLLLPEGRTVTLTTNGFVITDTLHNINEILLNLTFVPAPDSIGIYPVDLILQDNGNVGAGRSLEAYGHFYIVVKNVNDAPYFVKTPTALRIPRPAPCSIEDKVPYCPKVNGTCPDMDYEGELDSCYFVASILEDTSFKFAPGSFVFDDIDPDDFMKVTINTKNGTLFLDNCCAGVNMTIGDPVDGSFSWVISSYDKTAINNALRSVTYVPFEDWNGIETLYVSVEDHLSEDYRLFLIEVKPVNDAPQIGMMNIPKYGADQFSYVSNDTAWMHEDDTFNYAVSYIYDINTMITVLTVVFDDGGEEADLSTLEVAIDVSNAIIHLKEYDPELHPSIIFLYGDADGTSSIRLSGRLDEVVPAVNILELTPPRNYEGWVNVTMWASDHGNRGQRGDPVLTNETYLPLLIESHDINCCVAEQFRLGCLEEVSSAVCSGIGGYPIGDCGQCEGSPTNNMGSCCVSDTCFNDVDEIICSKLNGIFEWEGTCGRRTCVPRSPPVVPLPEPEREKPDLHDLQNCSQCIEWDREYTQQMAFDAKVVGDRVFFYGISYNICNRTVEAALWTVNHQGEAQGPTIASCNINLDWMRFCSADQQYVLYVATIAVSQLYECPPVSTSVVVGGIQYNLYLLLRRITVIDQVPVYSPTAQEPKFTQMRSQFDGYLFWFEIIEPRIANHESVSGVLVHSKERTSLIEDSSFRMGRSLVKPDFRGHSYDLEYRAMIPPNYSFKSLRVRSTGGEVTVRNTSETCNSNGCSIDFRGRVRLPDDFCRVSSNTYVYHMIDCSTQCFIPPNSEMVVRHSLSSPDVCPEFHRPDQDFGSSLLMHTVDTFDPETWVPVEKLSQDADSRWIVHITSSPPILGAQVAGFRVCEESDPACEKPLATLEASALLETEWTGEYFKFSLPLTAANGFTSTATYRVQLLLSLDDDIRLLTEEEISWLNAIRTISPVSIVGGQIDVESASDRVSDNESDKGFILATWIIAVIAAVAFCCCLTFIVSMIIYGVFRHRKVSREQIEMKEMK